MLSGPRAPPSLAKVRPRSIFIPVVAKKLGDTAVNSSIGFLRLTVSASGK
jgi:hypothetical protein